MTNIQKSEELPVANNGSTSNRQQKFTIISFDFLEKAKAAKDEKKEPQKAESKQDKADKTSDDKAKTNAELLIQVKLGLGSVPKPDSSVCRLGTFTLIPPWLISMGRFLLEVMVIFVTTVLVWIVMEHESISNGTCDMSKLFTNKHYISPHPMLNFECDKLPSSTKFVSFWSQWSNMTGKITTSELATIMEDISDTTCNKTPTRVLIAVLSGALLTYTVLVFKIKYEMDEIKDKMENFNEHGTFEDIRLTYWRLIRMNLLIIIIAIVCSVLLIILKFSKSLLGDTLVCQKGVDADYPLTCFMVFSLLFAGLNGFAVGWLWTMRYNFFCGLLGLQQHPDLKDKYEKGKQSGEKWTHETEPFFAVFGPAKRYRYDKTTFTLYFWD